MAWIPSHQSLANHPKTNRLMRQLNISRAEAIGYLHMLWYWSMDYAQDGDLTKFDDEEIAMAAQWPGDGPSFGNALRVAGFIECVDDTCLLHDWDEYGGKYIRSAAADAERKRLSRQKMSTGHPPDIHRMSDVEERRREEKREEKKEESPKPRKRGPASEISDEFVEEMVAKFTPTLGEAETRRSIAKALNHTSLNKAKDKRLRLRHWLEDDVAARQARAGGNGNGQITRGNARGNGDYAWFDAGELAKNR